VAEVSVRELRNHGGEVLNRVLDGETLTVTRDGDPVAELRPLRARPLHVDAVLASWRHLPRVDLQDLRRDVDAVIDPSL
jgi:prevent-host-death family protein